MRRHRALHAKIVFRFHQAATEKFLPVAIHRHSRRQWIVGRDEPAGEFESARRWSGTVTRTLSQWKRGKHRRYATHHVRPAIEKIAPPVDERFARLRALAKDHRRGNSWLAVAQLKICASSGNICRAISVCRK